MIVQPLHQNVSDSILFKRTVDKEKINIQDFEAGLVYTHADMISKKQWVKNKIDALRFNRK
jgi:hypothetical protein